MKTLVFCLSLLVAGVGPMVSNAQNPWAVSLAAGYGYDLDQLKNSSNPFPLVVATQRGMSEIRIGAPLSLQLGLHIPFGKRIGMETGLGLFSRSIGYEGLFQNGSGGCTDCKADISIRQFRVPLLLDLIPLQRERGDWKLRLKLGVGIDWSGAPDIFHNEGPASREQASRVEVFDLYEGASYMFLVFDDESYGASALAGLEWDKGLGSFGRLGLGLNFSRQLTSPTSLLIWGYDRANDERAFGYYPNSLQFTTLQLQLRYLYPF